MGFSIKFLSRNVPVYKKNALIPSIVRWKQYYHPPWIFLFHLIEIILICAFFFSITLPSIDAIYDVRSIISKDMMQIEDKDGHTYSNFNDISDFFNNFFYILEKMEKKSLLNLGFINATKPYEFIIEWKNGTSTFSNRFNLSVELFRHINSISLLSNFYTAISSGTINGCTQWNVNMKISQSSSYLFKYTPSLSYSSCPSEYVFSDSSNLTSLLLNPESDSDSGYSDEVLFQEIFEYIKTGKRVSSIFLDRKFEPKFNKSKIKYIHQTQLFSTILLIISTISSFILIHELYSRFQLHNILNQYDAIYRDLSTSEQVHSKIGYWIFAFLFFNILLAICTIPILFESRSLTQYQLKSTFQYFASGSLGIIICFLRWVKPLKKCYMVVLFFKTAFSYLMSSIIGEFPLVCGMMFISSFFFRFSDFSTSYHILFECFLALTFGDNISGVYEGFLNGDDTFNIFGFIWVTLLTAIAMWLFFTTFTASVTYVYKMFISLSKFFI